MERPKSANWMIPLMVGYGIFSVAMVGAAYALTLTVFDEAEIIVFINGIPSAFLWFLVFWSGIGFARAKPWALRVGFLAAVVLFPASIIGLLAFEIDFLLFFSSSAGKIYGALHLAIIIGEFIPISNAIFPVIFGGFAVLDVVVTALILWFCLRKPTRDWIAKAQEKI